MIESLKKINTNWWIFYGLFFILFVSYSISFSYNFPNQDDLNFINFLENFLHAATLKDYFNALFYSENDHIHTFPRLIVYFQYILSNELNYIYLQIIALLELGICLYLVIKTLVPSITTLQLIPLLHIVLQPSYYELSNWPFSGLCIFTAILLMNISFTLFQREKYRNLSYLFAFFATFSFGNGILTFVITGLILLLEKKWKNSPLWFSALGISILIILTNYHKGQEASFNDHLIQFQLKFFSILGSIAYSFSNDHIASYTLGLTIFIAFVYLIYYSLKEKKYLFFSHALFPILTILLISASRAGEQNAFASSRYAYFGISEIIVIYCFFIQRISWKKSFIPIYIISFFIFFSSYYKFNEKLYFRLNMLFTDHLNWEEQRINTAITPNPYQFLKREIETNLWRNSISKRKEIKDSIFLDDFQILNLKENIKDNYNYRNGIIFSNISHVESFSKQLALRFSNEKTFFYTPVMVKRSGKKNIILNRQYFGNQLESYFYGDFINDGTYSIDLIEFTNQKLLVHPTKTYFEIKNHYVKD